MSRENRPSREKLKFTAPENLPVADFNEFDTPATSESAFEVFEVGPRKPEESQTDSRVETAFQVYQATLKETDDKEMAQKKAWDKLLELIPDDITATEPFDQLAEKIDQAVDIPDIPEVKPRELENELPIIDKDTSSNISITQPQSDLIIDPTMAEKDASVGVTPLKNPPTGTFEVRPQKLDETETPKQRYQELQELKTRTEIVLNELNDTQEKIENLLQAKNLLPEQTASLHEVLKNIKLGISIMSKPGIKNERMLDKARETIAEAEKILSDIENAITEKADNLNAEALAGIVKNLLSESEAQARDIAFGKKDLTHRPETTEPAQNQDNLSQNMSEQQALEALQPELAGIPEAEREKLGIGLNNFGFYIKEKTNSFFANAFKSLANKTEAKSTAGRFLAALSESYQNDSRDAKKKMEDIAAGQKRTLGNVGYITGNIMKYGRTVADFVGWTAASPLRYVTISGQILERGLDVAKEARLKNDEVLEKTRIQDIDAAAEEAWRIYDQAQAKAGEKKVSVKNLEKAYQENIPQDLLKRLKENPEPNKASSFLQGIFKKHIEFSTNRLQSKIDKIEADTQLTEQDKISQKEKLFNNYSKLLNDFDRVLSQYGTIDNTAMLAKYGSESAKWAVRGVMVESLYLGLEKLWDGKIWHDLAEVLHGQPESSLVSGAGDLAALKKAPEQYFAHLDSTLGINSQDGLSAEELEEIRQYAQHVHESGNSELAQKISEHYKLPTTPIVEIAAPPPKATKPTHFEDIIDSSKVSGSDSIWKSTKQIFLDHSKGLGYKGEPNDTVALDKWAENQTGNMVAEMEKIKGRKLTDLVHSGDKVEIDLDAQGKPHLKFEVDSKLQSGYLEHHDIAKPQASITSPQESVPTAPATTPEITKTTFDNFKQTYESAKGLEHDQALINYLNETAINPENKIDYPADKINVFVRMFPIKGIAENIESLNTPEKIKKALDIFEQNLHSATQQLIDGQLNMRQGEPLFPIVNTDQRVFLAEPLNKNEWKLWHLGSDNKYGAVKLQRRFIGDKNIFSVKDLKKVLGYK